MARLWRTAVVLAVFAAGMWFAWLGWDHQYYEVNGVAQGPYRAWQVVGCGLTIVVATVLCYLRVVRSVRHEAILALPLAATVGFAVPWSVDAARSDETGMWLVGLFLLLLGGGAGLAIVLAVTDALLNTDTSPTRALVTCLVVTALLLVTVPYPEAAIVPLAGAAVVFFARLLPARRRSGREASSS